ncbi:unnamed protein product [Ostreobium quekettii]|uniref:Uncharacterized protein n=1 Tax=Ostreobium quekettii TaxID=121088 RepID=A0A8S1J3T0_9CHLO|nr:unnamed protein product [Ostreobium quekettii]|eukprot:evm.model.scf_422.5 EVM.evm.TU.scf_422.5   scf_422:21630-24702(+)
MDGCRACGRASAGAQSRPRPAAFPPTCRTRVVDAPLRRAQSRQGGARRHGLAARAAGADEGGAGAPAAGQADVTSEQLQETASLDELIDLFLGCKSKEEILKAVGDNILSLDQKFWLRLAARSDTADSEEARQRYMSLSRSIMALVDAIVKKADEQITDSAEVLQKILKAAADESGNWHVPLTPKEISALDQALIENAEHIDEALLSNAFAWMRKAKDDSLDGMVVLLQKVLQLYAARELKTEENDGALGFCNELLGVDAATWEAAIKEKALSGELEEEEFMKAVQMKLENTILLKGGSYAQRVQVEFLSELKERGQSAFKSAAASSAQ